VVWQNNIPGGTTMRVTWAVVASAALLLPSLAQAQNSRWEVQVRDQLNRAGSFLSDNGYTMTHELKTGSLRDDASEFFSLELDAGKSYAVVGVCDGDCTDMDLQLFSPEGQQMSSDMKTDDVPIVEAHPTQTARYRVKVLMAACTTSPCFYGVGVYGK
jgi:hypothetical protein